MTKPLCLTVLLLTALNTAYTQIALKGKVIDATTNQPVQGVTVSVLNNQANAATDKNGNFTLNANSIQDSIRFTSIGYNSKTMVASTSQHFVSLTPSFANLNEIVVSGSRDIQRRTEVPVRLMSFLSQQ